MSYIRAKEIPPGSGNWYDYEVKGVREGKKVRQVVIQYIGRSGSHISTSSDTRIPERMIATPISGPSTPIENKAHIYKMKTPASHIASALGMYYGGMPLDAIQQQFKQDHNLDMSESNYWNWVKRFTHKAIREAKDFKPEVGDIWIADETYMKLGEQNVYFWDIIDEKTRYLLASHASMRRSMPEARKLMELARERAGKTPKTVITDKWRAYIDGIEQAYGADTKHIQGGPTHFAIDSESTSRIERFHRTLEQRTKVMDKFKDLDDIKLLTDGWLINYNFFKQHEGIGDIPPAQCMSKIVPFKDWNDIVKPDNVPEYDYKVRLSKRPNKKKFVVDSILTPVNKY